MYASNVLYTLEKNLYTEYSSQQHLKDQTTNDDQMLKGRMAKEGLGKDERNSRIQGFTDSKILGLKE